jgi:hypothetical protein
MYHGNRSFFMNNIELCLQIFSCLIYSCAASHAEGNSSIHQSVCGLQGSSWNTLDDSGLMPEPQQTLSYIHLQCHHLLQLHHLLLPQLSTNQCGVLTTITDAGAIEKSKE